MRCFDYFAKVKATNFSDKYKKLLVCKTAFSGNYKKLFLWLFSLVRITFFFFRQKINYLKNRDLGKCEQCFGSNFCFFNSGGGDSGGG